MMNVAGVKDRPEAWREGPIRLKLMYVRVPYMCLPYYLMTLRWRLGRVVRSDDELRYMYFSIHVRLPYVPYLPYM